MGAKAKNWYFRIYGRCGWFVDRKLLRLPNPNPRLVLLYAASGSPLAQPWNCVIGNLCGAVAGVASHQISQKLGGHELVWVSEAFAVSLSIFLMFITKSLHPPGKQSKSKIADCLTLPFLRWRYGTDCCVGDSFVDSRLDVYFASRFVGLCNSCRDCAHL
jgi:hypothetical protein